MFPASIGKTGKLSRRPLVRTDAADKLIKLDVVTDPFGDLERSDPRFSPSTKQDVLAGNRFLRKAIMLSICDTMHKRLQKLIRTPPETLLDW